MIQSNTTQVSCNDSSIASWDTLDSWLGRLYTSAAPPTIDRTEQMRYELARLYTIYRAVSRVEGVVALIQKEATNEYEAARSQLSNMLESVGLSIRKLPKSTVQALSELSCLASDLGLGDMRTETLETAICAETILSRRRYEECRQLHNEISKIEQKTRFSRDRQALLRKLHQERVSAAPIEAQKAREWNRNADIIARKTEEYKQRLTEARMSCQALGVHERGLEYAQIRDLSDKVEKTRSIVEKKRVTYKGYSALPPDTSLAWLKLEEARQELVQLRIKCEKAADDAFDSER